jgi:hypothetical protein
VTLRSRSNRAKQSRRLLVFPSPRPSDMEGPVKCGAQWMANGFEFGRQGMRAAAFRDWKNTRAAGRGNEDWIILRYAGWLPQCKAPSGS